MTQISRRTFGKLVLCAGALAPMGYVRNGWAQGKEIQIGIWGGSQGEFVKKNIIPAFEKDFGAKVTAEEGFTLANVGKMRATKANPKFSVMFIDDVAIPVCKAEGLIEPLPADDMPALAKLYPRFGFDGWGTALAISVASMFNNTSITPPDSYAELWKPEFAGKLKLVSPKNTPSVFFLIVAAAVKSGKPFAQAQYLVDDSFDKVAELKPNIMNLFDNGPQAANEVAQGQADIGLLELSKYIYPYTAKGAPVTMSFPKEGSFAGNNCQVLVKGGPNRDLAVAFMNRMLEPAVQKAFSEYAYTAPPVSGIEFSPETLKYIAYPVEEMDKRGLFTPDWDYINARRSGWTEKLNGIFAV
ncbi:putative spermidine/putrescine transport system substrate-binding protein [Angulomicrobium tetraedrale]|uniref:Putative spermidine/putrescine transport system substrate-binding protein n=1 Tax=Ancylobacter tetraedralis TaxID=217068 RepID=A0A839ZGF1_9HYPH|nr:extracellular solute-binding protein [Ancylobacter tetraedralis]MBB3773923.1 putative spermidine/putrescine transport system substrate-binding protein [Ancylobacter tetraedralis]